MRRIGLILALSMAVPNAVQAELQETPLLKQDVASGRLSSYYSGEVLAPIGGETLPG